MQWKRLEATFIEPLAFIPTFYGLEGLATGVREAAYLTDLPIPSVIAFSAFALLGIFGYITRYKEQEKPILWWLFLKASAVIYFSLGMFCVLGGYPVSSMAFFGYFLVARKEIFIHQLFTQVHNRCSNT